MLFILWNVKCIVKWYVGSWLKEIIEVLVCFFIGDMILAVKFNDIFINFKGLFLSLCYGNYYILFNIIFIVIF